MPIHTGWAWGLHSFSQGCWSGAWSFPWTITDLQTLKIKFRWRKCQLWIVASMTSHYSCTLSLSQALLSLGTASKPPEVSQPEVGNHYSQIWVVSSHCMWGIRFGSGPQHRGKRDFLCLHHMMFSNWNGPRGGIRCFTGLKSFPLVSSLLYKPYQE